MSSRPELRLDWCTHEAAKYACEKWHYSQCIPTGKSNRIGVWESNIFKGVIIYARPAFPSIGKPFGLEQTDIIELVRVALHDHTSAVSRMLSISTSIIKKHNNRLRMIVSFADKSQGHHGGIYQAANWIYIGEGGAGVQYTFKGKITHQRTLLHRFGSQFARHPEVKKYIPDRKHKYVMPLDDEMRKQIEPLRKPYPKRVRSEVSGTIGSQPIGGGATPTRTLTNLP
jgi:hypothetical protein